LCLRLAPSLLTRRRFTTAGFMLRIKPLRLAGGYRVAGSTAPERERPRTGFVAPAIAVPAPPASALCGRGCVLPAACAVGHKTGPRLRRLHTWQPQSGALTRPWHERWSGVNSPRCGEL
ncbi:MAG: hypothetical protein SGI92_05605, partial [Bryobacteraceae bacterium]|nr:hypothetical protein [Bryobacteraceae bacterium]